MSNRELPSVPDTKQDRKRRESLELMKISNDKNEDSTTHLSKQYLVNQESKESRRKSCPDRPNTQINKGDNSNEENKQQAIRKQSAPIKGSYPHILKQNINLTYQSVYENV